MRSGQFSRALFLGLMTMCLSGCGQQEQRQVVTLWHQMRPADRAILEARVADFEQEQRQQGNDLEVRVLYKENEELRSGMEMAVLVESGPDLIYGPSDPLGVYQEIGALADMSAWFSAEEQSAFDPRTLAHRESNESDDQRELIFVGDRFGNHLALVYNRNILAKPPQTAEQFAQLAANGPLINKDGEVVPYVAAWNYTEPFFLVPFFTGYGAWVFAEDTTSPTLDTPALIKGLEFVANLKTVKHFLPRSSDYNAANELFLAGKAAIIINGDWSWQQYLNADGVDAAVTTLPIVKETGLPMASMVSPKGYSLSIAAPARGEKHLQDTMKLVKFLTNEDSQRKFLEEQLIVPSLLSLRDHELVQNDLTLQASMKAANAGRMMPTETEMRAVWDAMRPPYQSLMAGNITAEQAAKEMQRAAEDKIATLTTVAEPDAFAPLVPLLGLAALAGLVFWQRTTVGEFFRDFRGNRLAYMFALPSLLGIFVVVLFPLVFNIALSFSNMSLKNFSDWQIVGLHNYLSLFVGDQAEKFWSVFFKTVFWTAINVFFHVTLGVLLAVTVNGPVRGKSIYRLLLIIPWAVPAYITALTWRGMFDYEFGVVNQLVEAVNSYLPTILQLPVIDWLSSPNPAFAACIIANVWLGFPFMMVIALGGLQGIPEELYEAARIDRATRWQQFWNITVPMLKPVLVPAITLGAIWTFNNLNVVWLVSNRGEPADQTHILVSYVYRAAFNLYQYGYGAALSMVIFLILLVFSLIFLHRTQATEGVA